MRLSGKERAILCDLERDGEKLETLSSPSPSLPTSWSRPTPTHTHLEGGSGRDPETLGREGDGAQTEIRVSAPRLVEVMKGEPVTLNCSFSGAGGKEHLALQWLVTDRWGNTSPLVFAVGRKGALKRSGDPGLKPSTPFQLHPNGSLQLLSAEMGDERDYTCQILNGTTEKTEATSHLRVLVAPEPPEVIPNKGTISVVDDKAHEIATCTSRNANPAPNITWYRDGEALEIPTELNGELYAVSRTVREASGLHSLTSILYLRPKKADRDVAFHCRATYHLPNGQQGQQDAVPFYLTLHYPTENVQFWVASPAAPGGWVREGDTVSLLCRGDGNPTPEYIFTLKQGKKEEKSLETNTNGTLTLGRISRDQSGLYQCEVADFDADPGVELTQKLEIHVGYLDPLELSPGENVTLSLGDSTELGCLASGDPTPKVVWMKDSIPLDQGPRFTLTNVSFNSAGIYTCEASVPKLPGLTKTRNLQLLVQGEPELKPEEMRPQGSSGWTEGDEVTLTCSARGHPTPKLSWDHEGEPVNRVISGWVQSSLKLKVMGTVAREGVTCTASNHLGHDQHTFHFEAASQAPQAGVAVMAAAVSVGLLLLVVALFYCMRQKGRCCRRREKVPPLPPEPEPSRPGMDRPEQTGLLSGGGGGGSGRGGHSFGDEC
ncbi:basal cell adhesion molecule isoform X1 [Vombatus ursinus]|uniref:basal cell adhesion molecule isoform X1 n=1 Tax=Vombatus ursinus TaxID=29139 RepID=UPI000FFCE8E2|nr:basal cell adhesion molecule isoform X1 [Vombatus ursinus]